MTAGFVRTARYWGGWVKYRPFLLGLTVPDETWGLGVTGQIVRGGRFVDLELHLLCLTFWLEIDLES